MKSFEFHGRSLLGEDIDLEWEHLLEGYFRRILHKKLCKHNRK